MPSTVLRGHRWSPPLAATLPGYHAGRPPRNKGLRYPADPPRVEEIVAIMRRAGRAVRRPGTRADCRAVAGGSAHREALALGEADLDEHAARAGTPRQGRQATRGGMDDWGWEQLEPWHDRRSSLFR